jgi:hypothetical protein
MEQISSDILVGKVELDVEFRDQSRSAMNKWDWLRKVVANDIKPVEKGSSKGWAKIPLISKAEAIRGQQSILAYVRENLADPTYRFQTAIVPADNGHFDLMLRKVML